MCQPSWETEHQFLALGHEKVKRTLGKLLLNLVIATTKYFSPQTENEELIFLFKKL